jgi:hypothetical protein
MPAILILDFSGFLRRLTSSIGTFQDDKTMVLTFEAASTARIVLILRTAEIMLKFYAIKQDMRWISPGY